MGEGHGCGTWMYTAWGDEICTVVGGWVGVSCWGWGWLVLYGCKVIDNNYTLIIATTTTPTPHNTVVGTQPTNTWSDLLHGICIAHVQYSRHECDW